MDTGLQPNPRMPGEHLTELDLQLSDYFSLRGEIPRKTTRESGRLILSVLMELREACPELEEVVQLQAASLVALKLAFSPSEKEY